MSKLFRINARSRASFIFQTDDSITCNYVRDGKEGQLLLHTRYLAVGFDIPVPGDLQVLANVEAETVEEAITWATVGQELLSIVGLATNAAISHVEGEVVYEITPGLTERPHFQRFMPGDQITYSSRAVPMDAACALLESIASHSERDRLLRAITQYTEALQRWGMGKELLSLSHLFMDIEAITVARLRQHLKTSGLSREALAQKWGYRADKGYMSQEQFLNKEARIRLAFHGDELHHKIAKDVSDKFEHGLANGGALFAAARDALVPTAAHLRRSILEVAEIGHEHMDTLLGASYEKPRGLGGFEQYFRTTLRGEGKDFLTEDIAMPCWEWTHTVDGVSLDAGKGVYSYKPSTKLTARIPDGYEMVGGNLEVWDGGYFLPPSAEEIAAGVGTSEAPSSAVDGRTE